MMTLTDEQIKHMVDRFLGWSLPKTFAPDAGITFTRTSHQIAGDYMPTGTNVFDAAQAETMVRHMIEGMPDSRRSTDTRSEVRAAALEEAAKVAETCAVYDIYWRESLAKAIRALSQFPPPTNRMEKPL